MLADVHTLYESDLYRVLDFRCFCDSCSETAAEYNENFCISFIRAGFFEYQTFRRKDEMHAGRILLSKPGYEHVIRHIDDQPDITTILEFSHAAYLEIKEESSSSLGWLFGNNDLHSILLYNSPATEYLHQELLQKIATNRTGRLEMDELVMNLLDKVLSVANAGEWPEAVPGKQLAFHLSTAEAARAFIHAHFSRNISLKELALHCCVSLFHFSRLFRSFFGVSPYQYLHTVRLQHARALLQTTSLPVAQVAFECGFNSAEHFSTAYRQRFKAAPSQHRHSVK